MTCTFIEMINHIVHEHHVESFAPTLESAAYEVNVDVNLRSDELETSRTPPIDPAAFGSRHTTFLAPQRAGVKAHDAGAAAQVEQRSSSNINILEK